MYYSPEYVEEALRNKIELQRRLYCRGFIISTEDINTTEYPFYRNWQKTEIKNSAIKLYTHFETSYYIYELNGKSFFLVGHAYDPYNNLFDENEILEKLAIAESKKEYWTLESDLTGVFITGFISGNSVVFLTDATGMQVIYYGFQKGHLYITSHSKLVGDLLGLNQDDYIVRLVNSRFYRYWGRWLPGDLSPFRELTRVQPNFAITFFKDAFTLKRIFPQNEITEVSTEEEYSEKLSEIEKTLQNSLFLITKKWPNKQAAISLTGGMDSGTTLAAACEVLDEVKVFSYISVEKEKADAIAAEKICSEVGVSHKTYIIPETDDLLDDIQLHRMVLECNAGCIGHNNNNDVRKRAFFLNLNDFRIEIKSWVDELGRAEAQNKYNMLKWPKKPTPGYYRCMWKVIVSPRLIHETNKVFREYFKKYYSDDTFEYLPWMDLFYWEFSWSGGEGLNLTSEHRYAYDVTIPYNNRRLLNTMFETPLSKRLLSSIQSDIMIDLLPQIKDANAQVHNVEHTSTWTKLIRTYLKFFSKMNF